jgi:hemerythrin-like domain-containing protein
MALLHTIIISGLNSIYQQAPHVSTEENADFLAYVLAWVRTVNSHHRREELVLFPDIEKAFGDPIGRGVMQGNVEQHGERLHIILIRLAR